MCDASMEIYSCITCNVVVSVQLLPAGTPVLQLLTGWFCGFSPQRGDTFHRLSPNLVRQRKTTIPYAVPNFRWIDPYMGISNPKKTFKIPNFANLFAPMGRIPQSIFMTFISFMRLWGLRKCFKFGVIRCLTEGVIGRKPQSGNLHQIFGGPGHKNYGWDQKKLGVQNGTDVLYAHAKFGGDRWTHGDRKWETMLFFVCMFVFLYVCHAGCPGKRSGRSTTYNVTVCRAISMRFHCFSQKETSFPTVCRFKLYH